MSKIAITKKSNTIFLATVLIVGTIALSYPSFMIDAQAQPYYYDGGRDNSYNSYGPPEYPSYKPDYKAKYSSDNNNYKSKDSKSVSINKIKCINTNLNINGNNTGDINLGNKGQGYLGAYGSDGNGEYGGEGYDNKQGKGFDCIINNNNTNNNIVAADGGGNATLAVTKTVTCIPNDNFGPAAEACQFILSNAPPSSFNIVITGNNPNPPEFLGSSVPVVVTLGAGDYEITEEVPIVSFPDGASITLTTNFAGDCRDVNPNNPQSTEATGTIQAGESQICDISNDYRTATLP